MKTMVVIVVVISIWLTTQVRAGDMATEKTQSATAAIIAFLSGLTNQIKDVVEDIEELEAVAGDALTTIQRGNIPILDDIFKIAEDIEAVMEAGEALAYTAADVEDVMKRKFKSYDEYLQVVKDEITAAGEIPKLNFEQRFKQWSNTHRETISNVLEAHGLHADQLETEKGRLEKLTELSQSSAGRMQALQAGHQISIEEIKQMGELQQIIMEQSNLHASYFAMKQAMRSEQEAVTKIRLQKRKPTDITNGVSFGAKP